MTKILAIEDEPDVALALRMLFERGGYGFELATDGRVGLRKVHHVRPDLVILDVGLPEMDGWTVLDRVRDFADVPILMLTAHSQESEKVRGLRGGADDYLTKPFSFVVLQARLRALLRRAGESVPSVLRVGDLTLDPSRHRVHRGEVEISLTPREFGVLEHLMQHTGQVVTKTDILRSVWDAHYDGEVNVVEVYVGYLRRKIDTPFGTHSIETLRGVGYRMADNAPGAPGRA